jgi:UDP:flavonoid glycosyltransferase YjiC (YdhE family)
VPAVSAERVLVLAREPVADRLGRPLYSVADVDEAVRRHFGVAPEWVPAIPSARPEMPGAAADHSPREWSEVIDVERWAGARRHPGGQRPALGRHGEVPLSWPEHRDALVMAYPCGDHLRMSVLGDVAAVRAALGQVPTGWTVRRYDAMAVPGFLHTVDIAIHLGAGGSIDGFALRPVLESLASGVPTIVSSAYAPLLGDAACYAEPEDVAGLVRELHAQPDYYEEQSRRGAEGVRARFGPEQHLARVRDIIGEPAPRRMALAHGASESEPAPEATVPAEVGAPPLLRRHRALGRPRVLLISSNGAGMGHLTRLLAYAQSLGSNADARFLSMSQAVPVVGQWDYPFDYLPSAGATSMTSKAWQPLYYRRAVELVDHLHPDVVVFDGTWPYAATAVIRAARPWVRWVWSRRGMWRPEVGGAQLARATWFDAVLEPGDLAVPYDRGPTVGAQAHRVGPVTLVDRADVEDRDAARRALGLPADGTLALISLGAGTINDTDSDTGAAIAALRELGVGVCLTRPPISAAGRSAVDVHFIQDYPLARRYSAFDVVISASGYNSFHELLRLGVPSLFVPNADTLLDDQVARARYAADQGWAYQLPSITVEAVTPMLEDLLVNGRAMVAGAVAADPGNGAPAAAQLLLDIADRP